MNGSHGQHTMPFASIIEAPVALQIFSSCEASTDMTNSHMPVLEKYVNHLYDVTEADAKEVEALGTFLRF